MSNIVNTITDSPVLSQEPDFSSFPAELITEVFMHLTGPDAATAARFFSLQWEWTLENDATARTKTSAFPLERILSARLNHLPISAGERKRILLWAAAQDKWDFLEPILQKGSVDDAGLVLQKAAERGSLNCCLKLLGRTDIPATYLAEARRFAAVNGQIQCLRSLLLARSDVYMANAEQALIGAAKNGHSDCVGLLLTKTDIGAAGVGHALMGAAAKGHRECLKLLLRRTDVIDDYSSAAILNAGEHGHLACLQLLRAKKPQIGLFLAFWKAAENGHLDCLQFIASSEPI